MDERRPDEHRSGFWSTLPGILTGTAGLISAVTAGYIAFNQTPSSRPRPPAEPAAAARDVEVLPADVAAGPAASAPAEVRATVVDPDGWTNVRAAPSANASIIARVDEGEIFWARPEDGIWWPVRTAGGAHGYIHRSRVRLNP